MATSFVEFRGKGFWCNDSALETWLAYFLRVLDGEQAPASWLQQLRQEWQVQATAGFMGCIDLGLNQVAADEGRLSALLKLGAQTNRLLAAHGDFIPAEVLNHLPYKPADVIWAKAVATTVFLEVGELFSCLLEGKPPTTASSSLD